MVAHTLLRIQLAGGIPSRTSNATWNEHSGGPEVLLRWLETQLGLLQAPVPLSSRIAEFGNALEKAKVQFFAASLMTDRWGTAAELLTRRDELRMSGWDENETASLPPIVRGLAQTAKGTEFTWPDEAERLKRILKALDQGQVLGAHRCVLYDSPDSWPALWRTVLSRLTTEPAAAPQPCANARSALRSAQEFVISGDAASLQMDTGLQWIESRSVVAACEAVAAALAENPERVTDTTICCEDNVTALCLDGSLARRSLPTMGAFATSLFHPALQTLPLALNLCWEPVDPKLVLDFLSLPIGPIPRKAARKLAAALATQPGLGSAAWEREVNDLCTPENDPDCRLRQRLDTWLGGPRFARGQSLPAGVVSDCASRVAQWAAGYAAALEKDRTDQSELIGVLRLAAGHAATMSELAHMQGGDISESQLIRLRDSSMTQGGLSAPRHEAAGGPTLVSSLAEISGPCRFLVWIGLGTSDRPVARWNALERLAMKQSGVELSDGNSATMALRSAERRGFSQVTEALLAVAIPSDEGMRPHPIWQLLQGSLADGGVDKPVSLEELLRNDEHGTAGIWRLKTEDNDVEPAQPRRPLWTVDTQLFRQREHSSATELQDRLACPLKWVLQHQANLYASPIARLPQNFRLKGDFCHSVLEQVFGNGQPLPSVEAAQQQVAALFDKRLPLDAAPLAQPNQIADRQSLREELLRAVATLVKAMQAGGYRIKGIEMEVSGSAFGRPLKGWVDCVGECDGGDEVVVDFKYGGFQKYQDLLASGRAIQLATYAFSRSQTPGGNGKFPAVAYLVLSSNAFYSPSGSPILGDGGANVINAPAIATVWERFSKALEIAEGWLTGHEPVPARPLQMANVWPQGADLVLEGPNSKGAMPDLQRVCEYCDYQMLCGYRRLS